jgi:hypothetical protein
MASERKSEPSTTSYTISSPKINDPAIGIPGNCNRTTSLAPPRMISYAGIIFLALLPLPGAVGDLQEISPDCDCYVTSGPSSAYYSYHRFFNFSNLTSSDYAEEPANVTDIDDGDAEGQPGYLHSSAFTDYWDILTWGRPPSRDRPVELQNSRRNVWIRKSTGPCLASRPSY